MLGTELWSPNMQVSLYSKKNVVFLDATPFNVASFYRPIRGNLSVNHTAIFPIWLLLFTFVTYQHTKPSICQTFTHINSETKHWRVMATLFTVPRLKDANGIVGENTCF